MVVDTSALLAVVYREPDHERLETAVAADGTRLISAASVIEASIVVMRRAGGAAAAAALALLDEVIAGLGLAIEPVTPAHVGRARDAYLRYGKGIGAAGLNYGDCFAYALAQDSGEPLLFVGGDFARTDIPPCA